MKNTHVPHHHVYIYIYIYMYIYIYIYMYIYIHMINNDNIFIMILYDFRCMYIWFIFLFNSSLARKCQVEYAMEAINLAGSTVGILAEDGVILAGEKKTTSKLLDQARFSSGFPWIFAMGYPWLSMAIHSSHWHVMAYHGIHWPDLFFLGPWEL